MTQPTTQNLTTPKNLMTIRQMCLEFGVTARTLRFYEARALLTPQRKGQQRLYTRRDRARLRMILRAKRFGFSLTHIGRLLTLHEKPAHPPIYLREALHLGQQRLSEMRGEQDTLIRMISELDQQIQRAEHRLARYANAAGASVAVT